MGLLILNAYSILTDPATFVNPALIGLVVFAWLIAGAAFLLPLRSIRRLIVLEKRRLLDTIDTRLEAAIHRVSVGDEEPDAEVAPAGARLSVLVMSRDVVAGLPTWPWDSGAFMRFVSAALLPLAASALTLLAEAAP